mmetsp:Transcript_5848/g.10375  ORF Transcript_5848/g.10375 Transcript_5848/m.10375 type:complete len:95 (+) Transcript_5848:810-1094(+)
MQSIAFQESNEMDSQICRRRETRICKTKTIQICVASFRGICEVGIEWKKESKQKKMSWRGDDVWKEAQMKWAVESEVDGSAEKSVWQMAQKLMK